ncbi:unnamed protein product, partial [Litomosoides sigmodontis]
FDRVFVQLENNAQTVINIGKRLRDLAKQRHGPLCNPEGGTIIAALYSVDRCYYRASVCYKADIDSIVVFYVDYGNMASVNIKDAFLLEDDYLLSVPPQAVQIIIDDVERPRLTSEQIRNLLTDQTIAAQIKAISENGESFIANLFVKDEKNRNINFTEVILGERPAPTLPVPKPVTIDNFLDDESESVDYTCQIISFLLEVYSVDSFTPEVLRTSPNFVQSVCRDCGEPGHFARQCSVNRFVKDKNSDDSGRQRFAANNCFVGSHRNSNKGTRGRIKTNSSNNFFGSGFSDSKGRDSFGNRPERRDQSPRPFLDRDTHYGDTAADKSGWKSGNWTAEPNTDTAGSEPDFFVNSGFEEKTDKENVKSWIVNEDNWKVNNANWDLIDNGKVEASEGNPTAPPVCSNFDGVGNCRNACNESIETAENLPINVFDVSLQSDLDVDIGGVNVIKTTTNGNPSSDGTRAESNTISRIELTSLEEIKFGDTVRGLRSDGLGDADPSSFFVQLDRDKNIIEQLMLPELPADLPKLSSFEISQACIAPFKGCYYRAEIIGEENNTKQRVLFVDFGNVENIETSMLYVVNNALPDQFCISRRLAFHCRLHGIVPVGFQKTFSSEARKIFSELITNRDLSICFLQQSVKGIYEVTITLTNGDFVSDILISRGFDIIRMISRGFAAPFKWGIGPSIPLYEALDVLRSDELDHVRPVFTVQLSDSLDQLEQLNNGYVDSKKSVEVPQIGGAVISYFEEAPYRAEIIDMNINSKNKAYHVRYVDYGNENLCAKEELFLLDRDEQPDEILYTPRQGIRCQIDGVRPLNQEEGWSEEAQKCIDSLLAPCTVFKAHAGSPSADGVYPFRIMVLKNQLSGEDGSGTHEVSNANGEVDLANWLIAKGYAEMQDIWGDYPAKNLLADGEHKYEMLITEVDGQIIRARPFIFSELYDKMKKALINIKTIPLVASATTGLISLNGENKRAVLISSVKSAALKKCLLVDEGTSIEATRSQFSGISELCGSDGFLVRTCHRLSVQLRFTETLLDEKSREMIMSSTANGPVEVILVKYNGDNSYLISDIVFSDGTALMEKLKKTRRNGTNEEELVPLLAPSDFNQASDGSSNQGTKHIFTDYLENNCKAICSSTSDPALRDWKTTDSRPVNSWMKQVDPSNQVSEISNGIFDNMHGDHGTLNAEIANILFSLVSRVSDFDDVQ